MTVVIDDPICHYEFRRPSQAKWSDGSDLPPFLEHEDSIVVTERRTQISNGIPLTRLIRSRVDTTGLAKAVRECRQEQK